MLRLKFIGQQIMILVFITGIINVYAFEYWCNIRLSRDAGVASSHAQGHDHNGHTHGQEANHSHSTPHDHSQKSHHEDAQEDSGCCKDETARFFASLQAPDSQSLRFPLLELLAILPDQAKALLPITGGFRASPEFFRDVGLRPKIPDIRIYICSLII